MADYFIGDVQGCFDELMELLSLIHFDAKVDKLYFSGDLVNRGKQSLEVLRFVKNLGDKAVTVLGNHDIHYLAVYSKVHPSGKWDNFQDLLTAPDHQSLFEWMRTKSLIHLDQEKKFLLVHAGILPQWNLAQLLHLTQEFENELQGENYLHLLTHLYGNEPSVWSNNLEKVKKFRFVINCLTRMRYITPTGALELTYKGNKSADVPGYVPWFSLPLRLIQNDPALKIFFGHWAALEGKTGRSNVIGLDTGCCWGNCLTAIRLTDLKYFNVKCHKYRGVIDDESC
jgi:bis(5'-nucleosyl)-tetraphosphatase (symmetrical)